MDIKNLGKAEDLSRELRMLKYPLKVLDGNAIKSVEIHTAHEHAKIDINANIMYNGIVQAIQNRIKEIEKEIEEL